ncbi:MAG: PEP-CTERM sorting domain-containing protein [Phycisphaerae bacterium]|nr:PEP-CTERM sorting domain-containing protein [Phycisphaerae bacterium]
MKRLTGLMLVGLTVTSVQAANIVSYDFFGAPGNQASTAGASDFAQINVTPISRGAGLTATAAANSISASGWTGETSDWIGFSFDVQSGFTATLANFFFASRSSSTGPGFTAVRTSLDGFTSNVATIAQAPGANFVNNIVNLSGLGPITGTLEVRFYSDNTTSAGGGTVGANGTLRFGNYSPDGTTFTPFRIEGEVVPEPASLALLALGALAAIRRR